MVTGIVVHERHRGIIEVQETKAIGIGLQEIELVLGVRPFEDVPLFEEPDILGHAMPQIRSQGDRWLLLLLTEGLRLIVLIASRSGNNIRRIGKLWLLWGLIDCPTLVTLPLDMETHLLGLFHSHVIILWLGKALA